MLVLPRLPQQRAQRLARAPGASLAPLPPDASPSCSLLMPHPSRIPAPTAPSRSHPSASPPPRHANFGGAQNPVALLQLCVGRRCLIFQLLHADRVPMALAAFLADPNLCFVGIGVEADAERLRDDHGLEVASTVDLRGLAAEGMGRPDLRRAGLQAVVRVVMGVNLVKPQRVTMSRWDAYCLSEEQIKYACIDAFVSFEVGRRLLTGADY